MADRSRGTYAQWKLQNITLPPLEVMNELFDAYFDRVHWFICLFYEPSFRQMSSDLLQHTSWDRSDLGKVQVLLIVAGLGLHCVQNDTEWSSHEKLAAAGIDPTQFLDSLINEVRSSFVDLLEECSVESVQVCILLGTYYIYHGSPTLAWGILGQAVRSAYALAMHCQDNPASTDIPTQVRYRVWNHVMVADTFSAMIYGRPISLDPAFSHLLPLCELGDTQLPPSLVLPPDNSGRHLTGLSFHIFKHSLYEVVRSALNKFRLLFSHQTISPEQLDSLVSIVQEAGLALEEWRLSLPDFLNWDQWNEDGPVALLPEEWTLSFPDRKVRKQLILQALSLQLTYDNAIVFIYRPILEYRSYIESQQISPQIVRLSLNVALKAAMRISRVSIHWFENEFAISFLLMNFFTAGIILCIVPTVFPFSDVSHEARTAVLRIVHTSRVLQDSNRIARHTEQLLSTLLRLSLQQELESGLRQDPHVTNLGHASDVQPLSVTTSDRERHLPSADVNTFPYTGPSAPEHAGIHSLPTQAYGGRFDTAPQMATTRDISATSNLGASEVEFSVLGYGQQSEIDTQLDETLGAFGQGILCWFPGFSFYIWANSHLVFFNLVPGDPLSAWTWGSRLSADKHPERNQSLSS
ncbi:hypothetical protein N7540_005996 [Penicillium herquei]|nr:hypothetical protein N7540_005996 [Penicillium herquei]